MGTRSLFSKFRQQRLQQVYVLMSLLIISAPIVLMIAIPAIRQSQQLVQQRTADLQNLADTHADLLRRWHSSAHMGLNKNILNAESGTPELIQTILTTRETGVTADQFADARDRFTGRVHGFGDPFDLVMLLDTSGDVVFSTDESLVHRDFHNETWFMEALALPEQGMTHVGPLVDSIDGQSSYFYASPVYDSTGMLLGVLTGRAASTQLGIVLDTVPRIGETLDYYLVRAGQRYVVTPFLSESSNLLASDTVLPEVLTGVDGQGQWVDYRGQRVVGAYRSIDELGISLVIKQDVEEIRAGLRSTVRLQVILGSVIGVLLLATAFFFSFRTTRTLRKAGHLAERIIGGDYDEQLPQSRLAEVDTLTGAFNIIASRLKQLSDQQEEVVKARTRDLEITAQLGQAIAAQTEMNILLDTAINLIKSRLGYYHVQVFLVDDLGDNALLRASMGTAGKQMLERGHKLEVGSSSVVGQACYRGEPVLASDTRHADYWFPNPLLPDTRAELAVPLRVRDTIIGALDVQSTEPETFDEVTVSLLQTVGDQLAVAIQNARLFEEKNALLAATTDLAETLTKDTWTEYLDEKSRTGQSGFEYNLADVKPLSGESLRQVGELDVPIALRGTVIGNLKASLGEGRKLTEEEMQLTGQVLDRVALAIDNARLVEQTQSSLMQTNRLYQATENIASADSLQDIADIVADLSSSLPSVDRASLVMLEDMEEGEEPWANTFMHWLREGEKTYAVPSGRFPVTESPIIESLLGKNELFVLNNTASFNTVRSRLRNELKRLSVTALAAFPITSALTEGGTLGWLILQNTRFENAFSEDNLRFFETVMGQTANAVEGIRLFEQTQQRARRLQAQNDVSRAASSVLDPDTLLGMVVDRVSEAFDYYHVQIFLVDEFQDWAVLRSSTGEVGKELLRREHRLQVGSQSVIGRVTSTGETVIARAGDTDSVHRRNELLPDTMAEMAVPLKAGDRIIGALDLQSTRVDAFDADAQAILQSLADQIAVTLENAQLFLEIQERVGELTTVSLISQAVSRAQVLDEVYDVVAEQLITQFNTRYGFLGVLDQDEILHLPIFIEAGERIESPPSQPVGRGLSGYVIRTREILILNEDTEKQARDLGARVVGTMPKSVLIAPMLLGDEVVGVISIQDAERENAFNQTHVRQLTTLAAYVAVKIRNAQLLAEAERRAEELSFLFDVTRSAVESTELDEALDRVANTLLLEMDGAESSVIYLFNRELNALIPRAAAGYGVDLISRGAQVKLGEGFIGNIALRKQPAYVADLRQEPYPLNGESTRSAIAIPLVSGQDVVGVISVGSTQVNVFTESSKDLILGTSSTLTAVIQNAQLIDEVTHANEQLMELDILKSQFLANMSHELRTPLNSIIGFSRVMLKGIDGELNELQTQDLTTIYNSGQHLLGLINNILDLSKIEAGKMEIQPEYMSLEESIESVIATGKGLVKDKPITLVKDIESDLPQVYGDPVRVRQVLLNLVSNAAKFTYEGSITVRATRKTSNYDTGEPPRVQIDVVDTGIGIAEEDRHKLFEPFSQVDGSTTRQVGGTGLGLTITKEFVELQGGRIWVASGAGSGSAFSFTVPLHPPDVEITEIVHATEGMDGRPVVLAVDDEPGVLDLYARYLEKEGFALIGLNNANDLLGHVRNVEPVAIVLDLNLPGKTGWEAMNDLKGSSDTAHIPVVIASIDEDRERGLEVGAAEYLVKPIMEDDLIGTLNGILNGLNGKSHVHSLVIIDADSLFADALSSTLAAHLACDVHAYTSGLDAIMELEKNPPDAMLIDVDLPDMDGHGLVVSLRSNPATRNIPVVVVTNRELTEEQLGSLGRDLTFYVRKTDLAQAELFDEIVDVLGKI